MWQGTSLAGKMAFLCVVLRINFIYIENLLRDEILELIEGEQPSVLMRKKVGDRILRKVLGFVETFINGLVGK